MNRRRRSSDVDPVKLILAIVLVGAVAISWAIDAWRQIHKTTTPIPAAVRIRK